MLQNIIQKGRQRAISFTLLKREGWMKSDLLTFFRSSGLAAKIVTLSHLSSRKFLQTLLDSQERWSVVWTVYKKKLVNELWHTLSVFTPWTTFPGSSSLLCSLFSCSYSSFLWENTTEPFTPVRLSENTSKWTKSQGSACLCGERIPLCLVSSELQPSPWAWAARQSIVASLYMHSISPEIIMSS